MRISIVGVSSFAVLSFGVVCWGMAGPALDVASVKPAPLNASSVKEPDPEKITVTPKGVTMHNVTLRNCLRWAWSLRDSQISGPGWLDVERYEIIAGTSAAEEPQRLKLMMRGLLEQRFRLVLRREEKELPVYEMVPGKKGVQVHRSAAPGADEAKSEMIPEGGALVFRNYTMPELADRLATRPFRLDRVVVDRTGLAGSFDFQIKVAGDMAGMKQSLEGMERGDTEQPGMVTLIQEQLGVVLRPVRMAMESVHVESANRVPTEN